jgi:hypothetical protein
MLKNKSGNVMEELIEKERIYVSEMGYVIKGYKCEIK